MSNAIFHKDLLSHYQIVYKPGTYYVSAADTVGEKYLYFGDGSSDPRYLVPLRAVTGEGLSIIVSALKEAENGVVPFSTIRHAFLTGAIWLDGNIDEKDLPIKGEKLLAHFDYVEIEGENRLVCRHIELLPREELDYVDISLLDQFQLAIKNLITKA